MFLDIKMPKMDGYETTRKIRSLNLGYQPTIYALSNFEEDKQFARQSGMDGFISKALLPKDLKDALDSAMRSLKVS